MSFRVLEDIRHVSHATRRLYTCTGPCELQEGIGPYKDSSNSFSEIVVDPHWEMKTVSVLAYDLKELRTYSLVDFAMRLGQECSSNKLRRVTYQLMYVPDFA